MMAEVNSDLRASILVADDDYQNLEILIQYLDRESHEILYAPNGQKAYEITQKKRPDLIIMDWAMPLMNGIETTLKIKATKETKDIPIIMATGMMNDSKHLKEALEAGATDFLNKPFDEVELKARVLLALRKNRNLKKAKEESKESAALLVKEKEYYARELTIHAMHENEKNTLLLGMKKRIKKLENIAPKEMLDELKIIKKEINDNLSDQQSWDNFLLHFENVHPHFIANLKRQFPELTQNDLRIASYIKMGMDNKEIARVAGVKVESVKININRLKKRLLMTPQEKIRDFMLNM